MCVWRQKPYFCWVNNLDGVNTERWYVSCADGSVPDKDTDGDGIPDSTDPCPNNPNPNCKDPNNPPPNNPVLPDSLNIGGCDVDITALKAWLLSDSSFPFNFIYRVYSILSPLFTAEPQPPVIEIDIPLDPGGRYSWVPDHFPLKIDFLDPFAIFIRGLELVGIAWLLAQYGLKKYTMPLPRSHQSFIGEAGFISFRS